MRNYSLIMATLISCTSMQEIEPHTPVDVKTPIVNIEENNLQVKIYKSKKPETSLEKKLTWITRKVPTKKMKLTRDGWKEKEVIRPYVNSIGLIKYGDFLVKISLSPPQDLTTYCWDSKTDLIRSLFFYDSPPHRSVNYAHGYTEQNIKRQLDPENPCISKMQEEAINVIYQHSKNKTSTPKAFFKKCFHELTHP